MPRKKLIEVALPLDAINEQSAREKSIRQAHPSTMHLWWSRKPTATARAVLFAQLVDDPSERASEFRDEALRAGVEDVDAYVEDRVSSERARLFELISRMVNWDNINDERLFGEVRAEILRSTEGAPPLILDPFAGGGSIPLEAQRLGLDSFASDLNPVAVLLNKATIELPRRFAGAPPVFPLAAGQRTSWPEISGLAEDIRRYGAWMNDEAKRRIGHLFPATISTDGTASTTIAWIWARTVQCPNPACGIEMPLVSKWWLGKKKGKEAFVSPHVDAGRIAYSIGHNPSDATAGTVTRAGAVCVRCSAAVAFEYIRAEAKSGRMGARLIATAAEGHRARTYVAPTPAHVAASEVERPVDLPQGAIADQALGFRIQAYGMTSYSDLFTNRQLVALTTFSDLVSEARARIRVDAAAAGLVDGASLDSGGSGAAAYADVVSTYLALAVDRVVGVSCSLSRWNAAPSQETVTGVFGLQAIPMVWDFAEANFFQWGSANLERSAGWVADSLTHVPLGSGHAEQGDARTEIRRPGVLSTDPPYYDNIGYSDLSDFFYVWLRRSLRSVYPRLLSTLQVPKAEELVANPYRNGGPDGARAFFEDGFTEVFQNARLDASSDYPISVYYAFKQSESGVAGEVSTGWETILSAVVSSGWTVTATWPMRSERGGRMVSNGTNALASSIVLALRPRAVDAPVIDRRGFVAELRSALPGALRDLQSGSIAPVDLAQASIGPGMGVFSKYAQVIEPNGSRMPVRAALQQINAILAEVLSAQEADFDSDTRWCVAWFESRGFEEGPYGEAEVLASAKGSSVEGIRRSGALSSRAGKVMLHEPSDLPRDYDPRQDDRVTLWEIVMHLAREMGADGDGVEGAGRLLARAEERGLDIAAVHELAYLLFSICERKGWTVPGVLFNSLGGSWPEIRLAARAASVNTDASDRQLSFDLSEEA